MDNVSSESYVERWAREHSKNNVTVEVNNIEAEEQKDDRKTIRRKRQKSQKG